MLILSAQHLASCWRMVASPRSQRSGNIRQAIFWNLQHFVFQQKMVFRKQTKYLFIRFRFKIPKLGSLEVLSKSLEPIVRQQWNLCSRVLKFRSNYKTHTLFVGLIELATKPYSLGRIMPINGLFLYIFYIRKFLVQIKNVIINIVFVFWTFKMFFFFF